MKETLKDLRLQNGASVKDIASLLGVTLNAVSNYEVGVRRISLEQVLKLMEYYKISAEEIIQAQLNSIIVRKPN